MSLDLTVVVALLMGLMPGFEPRYTLPVLAVRLGILPALLLASLEVLLLSVLLPIVAQQAWRLLLAYSERLRVLGKLVTRIEVARQRAHRLTSRYGLLGLALFVAVPLPVTGIYTGAVVSLLGIDARKAAIALAMGGLASLAIVSLLTLGVQLAQG